MSVSSTLRPRCALANSLISAYVGTFNLRSMDQRTGPDGQHAEQDRFVRTLGPGAGLVDNAQEPFGRQARKL